MNSPHRVALTSHIWERYRQGAGGDKPYYGGMEGLNKGEGANVGPTQVLYYDESHSGNENGCRTDVRR